MERQELSLSKYNLKIIERSIKTISNLTEEIGNFRGTFTSEFGKLKGTVELLAKDIQAVNKEIIDHDQNATTSHRETEHDVQELVAQVSKMSTLLEASPYAKISDKQLELEEKITNSIKEVITLIIEVKTELKIQTENKDKLNVEKIKAKWNFRNTLVTAISTILGISLAALLGYLLK